jgi:hypothetical protein
MEATVVLKSPSLSEGMLESSAFGQSAAVEQVIIAGYRMGS